MSNVSIEDVPRWERRMNTLAEISDPANPCGDYTLWNFFVESKSTKVVFKCVSRKKELSEEELYRVVESCLPDGHKIGQLLGAIAGYSGHCDIAGTRIDLEFMFYFTCS